MTAIARHSVLGASFDAFTIESLTDYFVRSVQESSRCIIANHNLHSLYLLHHDASLRRFYELSSATHIDGMGVIALARILGVPVLRRHRITYVDWLPQIVEACATHQWRVFYLGSRPGVPEAATARLRSRFPALAMQSRHGYFEAANDSSDNQRIIDEINAFAPHVLMVGMGMPRQELWLAENLSKLNVRVALPCGAAMDYVAGAVPAPPRWLGSIGLEWAFRLAIEPRRLWRRYLLEPLYLMKLVASEALRGHA